MHELDYGVPLAALDEEKPPWRYPAASSGADGSGHLAIAGHHIVERFGHVSALRDANVTVHAGEMAALFGDNGLGGPTLLKSLFGIEEYRRLGIGRSRARVEVVCLVGGHAATVNAHDGEVIADCVIDPAKNYQTKSARTGQPRVRCP